MLSGVGNIESDHHGDCITGLHACDMTIEKEVKMSIMDACVLPGIGTRLKAEVEQRASVFQPAFGCKINPQCGEELHTLRCQPRALE